MLKFLSEFGPLAAFLIGYIYGNGMRDAALYMLLSSMIGITICYIFERRFYTFSLVSFGILFVSAVATLISGNSMFIKMKPTILYIIFACTLWITAIKNRPVMKSVLNSTFNLKEESWNILSYRFAAFFFFMAIINELVWRNFDELFWVKFKVFGAIPLTLLFILLQLPFLLKNKINDDTKKS
jgi:intracellular septation protein